LRALAIAGELTKECGSREEEEEARSKKQKTGTREQGASSKK
jgi:hypothetical protein